MFCDIDLRWKPLTPEVILGAFKIIEWHQHDDPAWPMNELSDNKKLWNEWLLPINTFVIWQGRLYCSFGTHILLKYWEIKPCLWWSVVDEVFPSVTVHFCCFPYLVPNICTNEKDWEIRCRLGRCDVPVFFRGLQIVIWKVKLLSPNKTYMGKGSPACADNTS